MTADSALPARIETCRFPTGKRMASITRFDDGHALDRRVIEAFNVRGIKGTFPRAS